ncbi:hypothetical protein EYF80_027587 [Liparis tanakae]|uniref:Uncharacterized protein n=1 Tax=Liparis tanakae TaxID=230148 RepID=A0A4Z2H8G7_9TELE|nr:hypothetical protein EYF80_027587 [Liparis tanakae]
MKSLRLTRVTRCREYCRDEEDGLEQLAGENAVLPDTCGEGRGQQASRWEFVFLDPLSVLAPLSGGGGHVPVSQSVSFGSRLRPEYERRPTRSARGLSSIQEKKRREKEIGPLAQAERYDSSVAFTSGNEKRGDVSPSCPLEPGTGKQTHVSVEHALSRLR